jgi:hypothetical protein
MSDGLGTADLTSDETGMKASKTEHHYPLLKVRKYLFCSFLILRYLLKIVAGLFGDGVEVMYGRMR